MADFKLFQKYFKEYQVKFGLTGYKIYFKHEPIEGLFASITTSIPDDMVATVALNSELPDKDIPFRDIRRDAKHEALHLLLMRLEINAKYRYSTREEIDTAAEEVVNKLEGLIK